jgi:hypothetical protein
MSVPPGRPRVAIAPIKAFDNRRERRLVMDQLYCQAQHAALVAYFAALRMAARARPVEPNKYGVADYSRQGAS